MKSSTIDLRNRFNQRKSTTRFKNYKKILRYVFQTNKCAYCRKPLHGEVHIDHVTPLSHSKSDRVNQYWNLVIACKTCNRIKSDNTGVKYPIWIQRRKDKYKNTSYKELLRLSEVMKHGYNGRN